MLNISVISKMKESMTVNGDPALDGVSDSILETYSAFANTFGGVILLGVKAVKDMDCLDVIGVNNPEKLLVDFFNTINDTQKVSKNILYSRHIYTVKVEGKDIVVIEVPRADRREKPIYIGRDIFTGTFRRNKDGNYHCSKEVVLGILRDQDDVDDTILDYLKTTDLNKTTINHYRNIFKNLKPEHPWNYLEDEEFLVKIGAAKKGTGEAVHPTLAGLLCFGNFVNIVEELPHYLLDYREYLAEDGTCSDRVISRGGSWSGNLFDFYFKVIDSITAIDEMSCEVPTERYDEMHLASSEVIINAILHADYYGKSGIVIERTADKIAISNPGTMRISLEDVLCGVKDGRNSKIANIFALVEIGSKDGLSGVYDIWNKFGLNEPMLEEFLEPERIKITLQI